MDKITHVSLKISDEETMKAMNGIKEREMGFSKVVRRLLRDFAANGYEFKNGSRSVL